MNKERCVLNTDLDTSIPSEGSSCTYQVCWSYTSKQQLWLLPLSAYAASLFYSFVLHDWKMNSFIIIDHVLFLWEGSNRRNKSTNTWHLFSMTGDWLRKKIVSACYTRILGSKGPCRNTFSRLKYMLWWYLVALILIEESLPSWGVASILCH